MSAFLTWGNKFRSQLGPGTDHGRLARGTDGCFYEITRGYKVTRCRTQASRILCIKYLDNCSEFKKKGSASPAVMGLQQNHLMWLRTSLGS